MSQPPRPDRVTVLRRPPVRQSTTVRSDPRHTFDTFVRDHRRLVAGGPVLRRAGPGP